MNQVLTVAFAVALLSVMETISVSKSTATNSGQRLAVNQDILGLSLGNILSAFISGVPVAGSSSRTALNFCNGAQTRLSGVFGVFLLPASSTVSTPMFNLFPWHRYPLSSCSPLSISSIHDNFCFATRRHLQTKWPCGPHF